MKRKLPPQENPMNDDTPPENQFYSVGFVCGMLQQPPSFVAHLMQIAQVEFDHLIDGVGIIRGDHLQKMAAVLQDKRNAAESFTTN